MEQGQQRCESLGAKILLLVLGFLLTGLLGSWFTYFWKMREWKHQQEYLRVQKDLEERYDLVEEVSRAMAETGAAASDVATMGYWEWDAAERAKDYEERKAYWRETSRRWRVRSRVIRQKIQILFQNGGASQTFTEIVNKRRQLGQKVRALLEMLRDDDSSERRQLAEEVIHLTNEFDDLAVDLTRILRREIRRDTS